MHVACWSYCWEMPTHSDPAGRTLLAFAEEIERLKRVYPTFPQEMGIFVGKEDRRRVACAAILLPAL